VSVVVLGRKTVLVIRSNARVRGPGNNDVSVGRRRTVFVPAADASTFREFPKRRNEVRLFS
jgi:hypothetical protein